MQLPSFKMFLKYFVKCTAKLQYEVQLSLQKQGMMFLCPIEFNSI
jgi:hypothetical protein